MLYSCSQLPPGFHPGHVGILILHSTGTHTSLITSSVCTLLLGQDSSTPACPHCCTKQPQKAFSEFSFSLELLFPSDMTAVSCFILYTSLLIKEERLSLCRFSFLNYIVNYHFCFYFFLILQKQASIRMRDTLFLKAFFHIYLFSVRKVLHRIFLIRDHIFLSSCTFKTVRASFDLWQCRS